MQRFCDVARTTLQHIKPRRDGRGNVKLVDINDDMRSMIQVFIKVAARYDEFKKASKSFNMSLSILAMNLNLFVIAKRYPEL